MKVELKLKNLEVKLNRTEEKLGEEFSTLKDALSQKEILIELNSEKLKGSQINYFLFSISQYKNFIRTFFTSFPAKYHILKFLSLYVNFLINETSPQANSSQIRLVLRFWGPTQLLVFLFAYFRF